MGYDTAGYEMVRRKQGTKEMNKFDTLEVETLLAVRHGNGKVKDVKTECGVLDRKGSTNADYECADEKSAGNTRWCVGERCRTLGRWIALTSVRRGCFAAFAAECSFAAEGSCRRRAEGRTTMHRRVC